MGIFTGPIGEPKWSVIISFAGALVVVSVIIALVVVGKKKDGFTEDDDFWSFLSDSIGLYALMPNPTTPKPTILQQQYAPKPSETPKQPETTYHDVAVNKNVRRTKLADCGNPNKVRGWFDLNGTGVFDDFCRFVGDGTNEWWSCTLSNETDSTISPKGKYEFQPVPYEYEGGLYGNNCRINNNEKLQKTRRYTISDCGNPNKPRGWFDLDNSGVTNDFCRYLGTAPNDWWSCTLNTDLDNIHSGKSKYIYSDNPNKYEGGLTGTNCKTA